MKTLYKVLKPGDVIGIIGGGQLGRMMAQSAKRMGFTVGILDPGENCPAAQVSDWHILADYANAEALRELATKADVVTFEFENIDAAALQAVEDLTAIPQGSEILTITQDRIKEKQFLESAGVSIAAFAVVETEEQLDAAIEKIGYPSVLKTTRFGYDGKGQVVLKSEADKEEAGKLAANSICVLEAWVPFSKELSVMIVRNQKGEATVFPVSENIHVNNILHESIVPARVSPAVADKAVKAAQQIADALQLVGTLGIEMFLTEDDAIYINELAPRPHNSGHYTIEAMTLSQFDAHIQAVAGLPMPKGRLLSPAIMVNILGQHMEGTIAAREKKADWSFHYYGKAESRTDRKMGHITILTDDLEETLKDIDSTGIWNGGTI
ncbi:rudiment single hybrid motif [Trichococcus palustris]|uniref:N5-carboxyaminoimidazole ribonucleotide synthase n=1 Tax=Trichococcus palustris TaxID=140314 RepID=A0A143Z313_9LACT|nr:rudiment single hybrid motif [Trichococcus palustris]SFL15946.1 5-(carboxyamino)imidazole ribonucleotide synthase [Trichococcus palustris]